MDHELKEIIKETVNEKISDIFEKCLGQNNIALFPYEERELSLLRNQITDLVCSVADRQKIKKIRFLEPFET